MRKISCCIGYSRRVFPDIVGKTSEKSGNSVSEVAWEC